MSLVGEKNNGWVITGASTSLEFQNVTIGNDGNGVPEAKMQMRYHNRISFQKEVFAPTSFSTTAGTKVSELNGFIGDQVLPITSIADFLCTSDEIHNSERGENIGIENQTWENFTTWIDLPADYIGVVSGA